MSGIIGTARCAAIMPRLRGPATRDQHAPDRGQRARAAWRKATAGEKMKGFSDFEIDSLSGEPDLLGSLRGEVVLVVNVASECGYTSQYQGLQELHQQLCEQGFSVIGLPCNQFGAQEPGSPRQIMDFCQSRFGVTFPLGVKIEVNGPDRHPLYAWLTDPENGYQGDITWNFEKFLIGRDGQVIARYPPGTEAGDPVLLQDIAQALAPS